MINFDTVLVRNLRQQIPVEKSGNKWEDNIKMPFEIANRVWSRFIRKLKRVTSGL